MPTKYTGRVLLILAVMYIAFCTIFPRSYISVFLPLLGGPPSWKLNLRPGIDMAGGTSLVYEIITSEDQDKTGLAERIATALKRRVDPQGVRNLIWRPQGDTRLEIQMPLSGGSKEAESIRDQYLAASDRLEQFNISAAQVTRVVENLSGEEREAELDRLAMGSGRRREVFGEVVAAWEALKSARASGILAQEHAAEKAYTDAKVNIEGTNLSVEEAEVAVEATAEVRGQRTQELQARNESFPQRQQALDEFIAAFERYRQVREEIADTASLKRLLQGSGVLQFHILADDVPDSEYALWVERLATSGPRARAGDAYRWMEVERPSELGSRKAIGPDGKTYGLVHVANEKSMDNKDPDWGLERAQSDQDQRGGRAVSFVLDAMGGRLFAELSTAHVGHFMAIVLDDRIVSAPVLRTAITGGSVIIEAGTGGFSEAEAEYLINTLNAGALPAQLSSEPVVERTVGPQLGSDNLRAGLFACYFGLGVVAVFLIGYYFRAGVVAFIAVLMNMSLILASMAAMNATFTLPSIAGIILALGMSVDANVLIFERLREEQARGLSIRMSLRNAYDRALSAILDSNITTGITAAILYIFGSEEVKGFGLTLLIGIFASLFTALFVTKTIFGIMVEKFGTQKLTDLPTRIPAWNRVLTPGIDWMGKAPMFMTISTLFIAGGCALFSWYFVQGRVLDVEFAGGTTAQFELREPMKIEEVRNYLRADTGPLADSQIVAIEPPAGLPNETSYEVVVPETDRNAVTAEIVGRLGDRLRMRQASKFAGHDRSFEEILQVAAFPIDPGLRDPGGVPVEQSLLADYAGGVAIVLRDMEPMLDREDLLTRFNHQRLKGAYDAQGMRGGVNVAVEVYPDMKAAVFLVSNDRYAYDPADVEVQRQWQADFAQPAWTLIADAVANPDELQKVTNIGGQVAGEFQRDALIALFLSILAIVAYIWLRFGDLKFGGATVFSLVHDTLFVIAAVGYAHLLAHTFVGTLLLLDPFRLNLTMVAAILTVIGFSMNDTVVVFDRIRENRGKYGKLTRQVINDSINQTLSRTLLTGGTTIATIALMYIIGGPGIHGFTFAMLVGILTGTYSSIAIASPVLLWGRARQPPGAVAGAVT